jgi:hypothetical protein
MRKKPPVFDPHGAFGRQSGTDVMFDRLGAKPISANPGRRSETV